MKKSRVFSPAVTDSLEARSVPSFFNPAMAGFQVTRAVTTTQVVATPRAVVTNPPVHHEPGTFSQGNLPTFFTLPSGTQASLNGISARAARSTTAAAVVVAPKAVVSNPPVHHEPGTFSQGNLPTFFTLPSGTGVSLNSLRRR